MGSRIKDRKDLLWENLSLKRLLDAAAPLCHIDRSQNVIYANKAFTSLTGLRKKNVIGEKCHNIWKCNFCRTDTCAVLQILRENNLSRYDFSKKLGDKNAIICDIIAVPNHDSQGNIDGIVQSVINISNHCEPYDINRTLIDNYFDLSLVISTEGAIINISESSAQALGKTPEDLLGKDFWNSFPNRLNGVQRECLDEAVRFSTPVRFERSRDDRWFEFSMYPLPDAQGNISRVAVFSKDITDRKIARIRLKQAYDKLKVERHALEEKNIALKQMIKVVYEERRNIGQTIKKNLDKCVLPHMHKLEQSIPGQDRLFMRQLRESLNNLLSPFISNLENSYQKLTPRELEICRLINQNLTSKEIASALNTSESTVKNQRKSIRKKLRISGKKINLTSILSQLESK